MIVRKTTKDIIAESTKELMKSRTLDKILVEDIANNCGISRRAFYNHFKDKHEVISYIYKQYGDLYFRNKNLYSWRDVNTTRLTVHAPA